MEKLTGVFGYFFALPDVIKARHVSKSLADEERIGQEHICWSLNIWWRSPSLPSNSVKSISRS